MARSRTALALLLALGGRAGGMTAPSKDAVRAYYEGLGRSPHVPGVFLEGGPCCHHEVDEHGFAVVRLQDGRFAYAERVHRDGGRRLEAREEAPLIVGEIDDPEAHGLRRDLLAEMCAMPTDCLAEPPTDLAPSVSGEDDAPISGDVDLNAAPQAAAPLAAPPARPMLQGLRPNLVLMIRFKDHRERPLPPDAAYETLFNGRVPHNKWAPTGSLWNYYQAQSMHRLDVQSTLTGWIDVSFTEREAADGCSGMCIDPILRRSALQAAITEALDKLVDKYDFKAQFDLDDDGALDGLTVIHSGYAAEWGDIDPAGADTDNRIWSHKWALMRSRVFNGVRIRDYSINPGLWGVSGINPTRLGVIAHELGHFYSLPDLYDSVAPIAATFGSLGIMSNSWGPDGSQLFPGSFSPYCKELLGWVDVEELEKSGEISLEPVQRSGKVLRISRGYPAHEYLLIESRSNDMAVSPWDSKLAPGIYVWHIDTSVTSGNALQSSPGDSNWPMDRNRVRVIQQDNKWHFERERSWWRDSGDAYREPDHVLSDFSTPSLLPYAQLAASEEACVTTGNSLHNFHFSNTGASTFTYTRAAPGPCSGSGSGGALPGGGEGGGVSGPSGPSPPSPSTGPTPLPTTAPTHVPTSSPSAAPTTTPTHIPTVSPSGAPSQAPTDAPRSRRDRKERLTRFCERRNEVRCEQGRAEQRCFWNANVGSANAPLGINTAHALGCYPRFLADAATAERHAAFDLCTSRPLKRRKGKCAKAEACFWNPAQADAPGHNPHFAEQCLPLFLRT